MKKILFLTGTRADYGKIKSLMKQVQLYPNFELNIFVTGMHMLSKYGLTWTEIEKDGFDNYYLFINQQNNSPMDIILSNTILGLSNYIHENNPDLIVVHGDRLEALAGAIVGAFNNIKVAHVEGGEISGTIDESIRHAITKFSHIHLVSNSEAEKRVIQLGERQESVFTIGSPDIDIMMSDSLPDLDTVKKHYEIDFNNYAIVMYHPVTTEVDKIKDNVSYLVDALLDSKKEYIIIYPNNDEGSSIILDEYTRLEKNKNIKLFPSIRFEYFLTLLNNSKFIIGNSSAGVREAEIYGIPAIDIGNRQKNRYKLSKQNIIHVNDNNNEIKKAIKNIDKLKVENLQAYGDGNSDHKFIKILNESEIWDLDIQKNFTDLA